jgi:hypothetical protein
VGYVARMSETRNISRFDVGITERRKLENVGIDGTLV